MRAVRVRSGLAYVAQEARLSVFDIRDVATGPRLLGNGDLFPDPPADVAIVDDLAYVLLGSGLRVVDIADSSQLRTVGSLDQAMDMPSSIAVGDDLAFVAAGNFHVVDLSDPLRPRQAGVITGGSSSFGPTAAQGHVAYVAQREFATILRVVDAADPSRPRIRGSLPLPDQAQAMAVSGDTLFVATWAALLAVDVSDPDRPEEIGRFTLAPDRTGVASATVSGPFAWLAVNSPAGSRLDLLNVADPTEIRMIGEWPVDQQSSSVAADGPMAVLVTKAPSDPVPGGQALQAFVATPRGPEERGPSLPQPALVALAESGNVIYARLNGTSLVAVDVGVASRPLVGEAVLDVGAWSGATVVGHSLVGAEGTAGLRVVDITDPLRPRSLALLSLAGEARYIAATARGTVVVAGPEGLWAVGLSDPGHPRVLGRDTAALANTGLAVVGDSAVTTRTENRSNGKLHITDLSDPRIPRAAGELDGRFVHVVPGPGTTVLTATSAYAFDASLVPVDIAEPDNPRILTKLRLDNYSDGDLAYVAGHAVLRRARNNDGSLLVLFDVADPALPTLAGEAQFPDVYPALLAAGDRLLVSGAGGSLTLATLHTGPNLEPSTTPTSAPRPTRTPTPSPTLPAPGTPAADGTRAFLPRLENGDAANKGELLPVAQLGGPAWDVATDGRTAFVGLGPRVQVFDVSAAEVVRPLGAPLAFDDVVQGLELVGQTLYVAAGRDGVVMLDVGDPAAPRRIGGLTLAQPAQDVAWDGKHLFVAAGRAGLKVLDVADPQRPTVIGAADDLGGWSIWRVIAQNGYAFVLSSQDYTNAAIVDVHDPTTPHTLSFIRGGAAEALATDGRYIYVGGHLGVDVFDVTQLGPDPQSEPEPLAHFAAQASGLALAADRLYIASEQAFEVWDVHDRIAARRLSIAPISGNPASLVVVGGRALMTYNAFSAASMLTSFTVHGCLWPPGGGLRAIDLSDELAPRPMPMMDTPRSIVDVAAAGEYVVAVEAVDGRGRLWVLDEREPSRPRYVAQLDLAGNALGLVVAASHAYVAERGGGLEVVDIADPLRPRSVGQVALPDPGYQLAVSGSTVFAADLGSDTPIHAVDVSDPAHPRVVQSLAVGAVVNGLAAANGYLYAATYSDGERTALRVYAANDPAHLRLAGALDLMDGGAAPVADGRHVYLLMPDGGVGIVDVTDASRPIFVAAAPGVDSEGRRLTVAGDRAYVAGRVIAAFDVGRPAAPRRLAAVEPPTFGCEPYYAMRLAAVAQTLVTVQLTDAVPMDFGLLVWRLHSW